MGISTENIIVGQIIKNYNELCKLLGDKVKSGARSRKFQHNEWKRYFSYVKNGHKYIITEIFSEPMPKIDNRGKSEGSRNNYKGIYAEYIDVLLFQYLKQEEKDNYKIYTTNNKIAESCGIVNKNYRIALEHKGEFYNTVKEQFNLETNIFCMIDAFQNIKTKIREIVKSSLDRLKKAKKLDYELCHFVYIPNFTRLPTEEELKSIINAEELIMKEMGVEHKKQIDNNEKLLKEFRKKVLKKVQKEFEYIISIYKGYVVILCEDVNQQDNSEIKKLRDKFNDIVVNSLKEKPQKIQDKTKKQNNIEGWIGLRNSFWSKWVYDRVSKKYIQYCINFIDILCNLQAEYVGEKIRSCGDYKIPYYSTRKEKEDIKQEDNIIMNLIDKFEEENEDY